MSIFARIIVSMSCAALLAACAGAQSPNEAPGLLPQSRAIASHSEHGGSWMSSQARDIKRLLYLSDSGADVFVYDYDNFEQVGTLKGFGTALGACVDAKGDIWIVSATNGSQGGGDAVEFAHGGTTILNTVTTNQPPEGCSVSPNGDLEITEGGILSSTGVLGPSEIQIWKNASGSPVNYAVISNCYHLSSGGYDNKGNLYVTGSSQDASSAGVCDLRVQGKALLPVSMDKAIADPVGIMWDGKYMAVTDVYYSTGDTYATAIYQTEERRNGKTLKAAGSTTISDTCLGDEVFLSPPPFIVGKKNTPINSTQGTDVAGFNFICGINPSRFRLWTYPAGGSPVRETNVSSGGGEAVSIAP